MRYVITPGKKADPQDESGKKKIEYLTASIWPGPWSIEHTAGKDTFRRLRATSKGWTKRWPGSRRNTITGRLDGRTSLPFWTVNQTADT